MKDLLEWLSNDDHVATMLLLIIVVGWAVRMARGHD